MRERFAAGRYDISIEQVRAALHLSVQPLRLNQQPCRCPADHCYPAHIKCCTTPMPAMFAHNFLPLVWVPSQQLRRHLAVLPAAGHV